MNGNPQGMLRSETLVHTAGRIAHLGGWLADLASGTVVWSDAVCDIYEVPHASTPTIAQALAYCTPDWRALAESAFNACVAAAAPFDLELEVLSAKGTPRWVRVTAEAVCDDQGKVYQVHGAIQDISARKLAELRNVNLAARLAATLESITDAVLMLDRNWNFSYLNAQAERLLHCPRAEVLGTNIWLRFPDAVGGPYYQHYHKAMDQGCVVSFEEYYEPLKLWTEIRAYPSEDGLAIYFMDINERKAVEAEIHQLAFYDTLTGLPNRQLLLDRLDQALIASERERRLGAVLFLDLDNFKSINDTRGHDKGDILLKLVAQRLRLCVRAGDTVARFGGDEFVILLGELGDSEQAAALHAQAVAEVVHGCFGEPFDIAGEQQYSSASIGVSVFGNEQLVTEEVLKRADLAMYQAKAGGRAGITFYFAAMQARVQTRVTIEADLRRALAENQFVLHYQPLADVAGRMTGVEALVRWQHPSRGLVAPNDFIPIAEETGMILALGRWVLQSACAELAGWALAARTAELTIAVNVSAAQFHRSDFVDTVLTVLQETGANPALLKLELTESLLLKDVATIIAKMDALRAVGVGFSLDDFGTGYSSLSSLHMLPLYQLKIDRTFVHDALGRQHGAVIARTILALGKALDLQVLAEGVETQQQLDLIISAGCQSYQGYLYSRPLAAPALAAFIASHSVYGK